MYLLLFLAYCLHFQLEGVAITKVGGITTLRSPHQRPSAHLGPLHVEQKLAANSCVF
jgi:hypothetical protein